MGANIASTLDKKIPPRKCGKESQVKSTTNTREYFFNQNLNFPGSSMEMCSCFWEISCWHKDKLTNGSEHRMCTHTHTLVHTHALSHTHAHTQQYPGRLCRRPSVGIRCDRCTGPGLWPSDTSGSSLRYSGYSCPRWSVDLHAAQEHKHSMLIQYKYNHTL